MELISQVELGYGEPIESFLSEILIEPARSILERPGKKIRAQLVECGASFGYEHSGNEGLVQEAQSILESLHAGSLVIDDIQDNSMTRRGEPTLHRRYGVPLTINVGNWLYFLPLDSAAKLKLSPELELRLYQEYHNALFRAHYGQAIDLGVQIDSVEQKRVKGLCLSSIELKSGALTAFALVLGSVITKALPEEVEVLRGFGNGFGIALQMFDDIGNLMGSKDPEKKWEDLRLLRPTWVWACFASYLDSEAYLSFKRCVRELPEENLLADWLEQHPHLVERAKRDAHEHLDKVCEQLNVLKAKHSAGVRRLLYLSDELRKHYV